MLADGDTTVVIVYVIVIRRFSLQITTHIARHSSIND